MAGYGFVVVAIALDRNAEDARPWIEEAKPSHPSLIDSEHRVAELYGVINIPTTVWIDEAGRIVRPHTLTPVDDKFIAVTGVESGPILESLRAWVREGTPPFEADAVGGQVMCPTPDEQLARAEFALGRHLAEAGLDEAAERHFLRAGELSPNDWTIRRAALVMRGLEPMAGPEFIEMLQSWNAAGKPYYPPRPLHG